MNPHQFKFNMLEPDTSQSKPLLPSSNPTPFQQFEGKRDFLEQTRDEPQSTDLKSTRSRKKLGCSNEISFQNNFLEEHTTVFDCKLQNFIESICECSQKIDQSILKSKLLLNKNDQKRSSIQILNHESCPIKISEKLQFKVDLMHQNYLKQFLDHVAAKLVPQVATQFIAIADFIWVEYLKIIDFKLTPKQLESWGKNIAINKFQCYKELLEKTQIKCFEDDLDACFSNFQDTTKDFMAFFMVTLILTIEGCFENPFSGECNSNPHEDGCFKRFPSRIAFSSDESEEEIIMDILGGKKRNYGF